MNKKTFSYIDKESGRYVTYKCNIKKEIGEQEIEEFCKKLYGMRLDSNLSDNKIFKDNKSTIDLIKEFKNIIKSEIIDFDNFIKLFSSEKILSTDIIKVPLNNFFEMFEFNNPDDFSKKELNGIIRATTMPAFQKTDTYKKTKAEMKSINPNTKLIKKTGYVPKIRRNKVLMR